MFFPQFALNLAFYKKNIENTKIPSLGPGEIWQKIENKKRWLQVEQPGFHVFDAMIVQSEDATWRNFRAVIHGWGISWCIL